MPAARATSEATAPGSIAAATIRSFSARDHRRRRCTDVITSTCAFVIGLALVIVLGLDAKTHLRKAAFTGRVRCSRLLLARNGPAGMPAIRSLSGAKRTLSKPPSTLVYECAPSDHFAPSFFCTEIW